MGKSPVFKGLDNIKELVEFMRSCDDKNAREHAVTMILLAAGHSEKEVADMLGRNERTIRTG